MESALVHYEVFVRKNPASRWVLELATDKPHVALAAAEDLVVTGRVAGAMVTKETFDEKRRIFHSETLFKEAVEGAKRKASVQDWDPLCVTPQDLYTDRARERIAGFVEGWLARNKVTVFELLHNADLVERLEAASTEMQHAVQKFALAEVQVRGGLTHDIIRRIQGLLDAAGARLRRDHRNGAFGVAEPKTFAALAQSLLGQAEPQYRLAGAVAGATAKAGEWPAKVALIIDLLDAAPEDGPARALALSVLEQPLAEMMTTSGALQALMGECEDLGGGLCALTRLTCPEAVATAAELDPRILQVMPELGSEAKRLAERLAAGELEKARTAAAKRILADLYAHKRLRPDHPAEEVMVLRALVMSLTAATGALLPEEDLAAALASRSRTLLSSDFLEAYLGEDRTAFDEAKALVWLAQNVVGAGNKRRAGRLLQGSIFGLKFETEALSEAQSPAARLAALAGLQRSIGRAALLADDVRTLGGRLGQLGAKIEAKADLVAALLRAAASPMQKLGFLLKMAAGETAPLGPAADRAKGEALKLIRDPRLQGELARDPAQMSVVRDLVQQAGLAA